MGGGTKERRRGEGEVFFRARSWQAQHFVLEACRFKVCIMQLTHDDNTASVMFTEELRWYAEGFVQGGPGIKERTSQGGGGGG